MEYSDIFCDQQRWPAVSEREVLYAEMNANQHCFVGLCGTTAWATYLLSSGMIAADTWFVHSVTCYWSRIGDPRDGHRCAVPVTAGVHRVASTRAHSDLCLAVATI